MGFQLNPTVPESVEGQFLALAFKHGYRDRTRSEREALQALKAEWTTLLAEGKSAFEASAKQYADFGSQYFQQLSAQKKEFAELAASSQQAFHNLIQKSETELRNIEMRIPIDIGHHSEMISDTIPI